MLYVVYFEHECSLFLQIEMFETATEFNSCSQNKMKLNLSQPHYSVIYFSISKAVVSVVLNE